jgi:hypothetical protein
MAQLGSASALGAEGRRFESYYPDGGGGPDHPPPLFCQLVEASW